jgi:hypothetical protein
VTSVAFPQPGEVRAFEQELADKSGQVGGVGISAGQGPHTGDAPADLVIPVGLDVARHRVQEQEPADVALAGGPVVDPGVERQSARIPGEQVQGAAGDVSGARAQSLQQQLELGAHSAAGRRRLGCVPGSAGGRAGAGLLAALETGVVVDAHAGEGGGDFFPAQPRVRRTPGALDQADPAAGVPAAG